jgi:hypothetical protein
MYYAPLLCTSYYRRKRGTYGEGQNYRFAQILEEAIPVDDVLHPTKTTTTTKKNKAPKK